jgi:hypothetical protein
MYRPLFRATPMRRLTSSCSRRSGIKFQGASGSVPRLNCGVMRALSFIAPCSLAGCSTTAPKIRAKLGD